MLSMVRVLEVLESWIARTQDSLWESPLRDLGFVHPSALCSFDGDLALSKAQRPGVSVSVWAFQYFKLVAFNAIAFAFGGAARSLTWTEVPESETM
jgi:hypothetical protein